MNSDPYQNVVWKTPQKLESVDLFAVIVISVQPEKEFLNRRKRKVVLC